MSYYAHLGAMLACLATTIYRRNVIPLFAAAAALCTVEMLLWPLCLQHPMLWYALESVTVLVRVAAAIEAVQPAWDAWIGFGGVLVAISGVLCAWFRPMMESLWLVPLMRARGFLWLALAVLLLVLAAHHWTGNFQPCPCCRRHLTIMGVYFAEHCALSFWLGNWNQGVTVHHWLSAGIYLGFATSWAWPVKNTSQNQIEHGQNCQRELHASSTFMVLLSLTTAVCIFRTFSAVSS